MNTLPIGDRCLFLISQSGRFDWPVHQRDKSILFRKQFITYIGSHSKAELLSILENLEFDSYEIRKAKRLPSHKWEAKIYGLAWDDARQLPITLNGVS